MTFMIIGIYGKLEFRKTELVTGGSNDNGEWGVGVGSGGWGWGRAIVTGGAIIVTGGLFIGNKGGINIKL